MAKVLQGIGVEKISGTIGGTTFQTWRGMLIARGKPTPHNPQTARQTRIRSIVSTISRAWRDVLTIGQRVAWNQFAEVFPWFDVFGRSLSLTGISLFLKINTVLLDHDLSMQITPPPPVEPPELTNVTLAEVAAEMVLKINQLTPGIITAQGSFIDVWVAGGFVSISETGSPPPVYVTTIGSQCLPAGRKHQKSNFRHVIYRDDTEVSTPEEQNQINIAPIIEQPVNCVVRLQRYNKFGRYSVPVIFEGILVA